MSRVGRQPIDLPSSVQVNIANQHVTLKGPKGELDFTVPEPIRVRQEDQSLLVERPNNERKNRSLHGTSRALLANMVTGVTTGFQRKLLISGVGYRASAQGNILTLELGFSHPIKYELPEGVSANVEKNVEITLTCIDKQVLGEAAAKVRSFRPPEPYKGKGVRYEDEYVRRKVGKKNV